MVGSGGLHPQLSWPPVQPDKKSAGISSYAPNQPAENFLIGLRTNIIPIFITCMCCKKPTSLMLSSLRPVPTPESAFY